MKNRRLFVVVAVTLCLLLMGALVFHALLLPRFDTPQYTIRERGGNLYLKFKPGVEGIPAKVGNLNCGMVGIESGVRFSSVSDAYNTLSKGELDASAIQFVMDEFSKTENGYRIFDFRKLPTVPAIRINSVHIFSDAAYLYGDVDGKSVDCFVGEDFDFEFVKNELSLFLKYSEDSLSFGTESRPENRYSSSDGTSRKYVLFQGKVDGIRYYACTCDAAEDDLNASGAETKTVIVGVRGGTFVSFRCDGAVLPNELLKGLSFGPADRP